MSYQDYLKSDHWQQLRAEKLKIENHRCSLCPCTVYLQVHHLVYRNPLTLCTVQDLQVVCAWCHAKLHRKPMPPYRKPERFKKQNKPFKTKQRIEPKEIRKKKRVWERRWQERLEMARLKHDAKQKTR